MRAREHEELKVGRRLARPGSNLLIAGFRVIPGAKCYDGVIKRRLRVEVRVVGLRPSWSSRQPRFSLYGALGFLFFFFPFGLLAHSQQIFVARSTDFGHQTYQPNLAFDAGPQTRTLEFAQVGDDAIDISRLEFLASASRHVERDASCVDRIFDQPIVQSLLRDPQRGRGFLHRQQRDHDLFGGGRSGGHDVGGVSFRFLCHESAPRLVKKSQDNTLFCGFNPAVSTSALKSMRTKIRELNIRRRTELSLAEIAHNLNPLLRGWINYYGRYAPSALAPLLRYVNQTLLAWTMRKFKRFTAHKIRASQFLQKMSRQSARLFVHWQLGMTGVFA
jgi:hypothetical protein